MVFDLRKRHMAREGVDAQVVFPNIALNGASTREPTEYAPVFAEVYNNYVAEVFGPEPHRFKAAAMLPTDAIEDTLAEAERCILKGFATFFMPCVVPWQPYRLRVWEPFWDLVFGGSGRHWGKIERGTRISPIRVPY